METYEYNEPFSAVSQSEMERAAEDLDMVPNFFIAGILLNFIGVLGLTGNSLSIAVLSRPQMKNSINCILLGLASFDLIVILTAVLMFGLPGLHQLPYQLGEIGIISFYMKRVYPFIIPYVYPIGVVAQTASVYLTVCVSIERYVAVCKPLRAKSVCTYKRAKIAVLCTAVFSIVYNLPRFFETATYQSEKSGNETDTDEYQVSPTRLRLDKYYVLIYIHSMYLIFHYVLPLSLLAVYNCLIYLEIRRTDVIRAQLSRNQKRELGLAMMLVCVVIVFFLCNILPLVVNVLELMRQMSHVLLQLSNLLVTLNSSANFIIYCIFGEKFRKIFLQKFCACSIKPQVHGVEMERRRSTLASIQVENMFVIHKEDMNGDNRAIRRSLSPALLKVENCNGRLSIDQHHHHHPTPIKTFYTKV